MKIKRIIRLLSPYKTRVVLAFIAAIVGVTLSLFVPVLTGQAIDYIIAANNVDFPAVIKILLLFGISILISSICQWVTSLFTNSIVYKITQDLRVQALNKINTMPIAYIDTHAHGDLVNRIVSDITQIGDGLVQGLTQLFSGVVTILGTLIFMLTVNGFITIIVVVVTPLSILVASFIVKQTNKYYTAQSEITGTLSAHLNEMATNQKVIKAFASEDQATAVFTEIDEKLYQTGVKAQLYSSLANPATRFVNGLVYAAVGIVGAITAINGRMSVGQISSFLSYANQYTKPFNEVSGVVGQIQTAFASADRVFELLDEPEELDEKNAITITKAEGRVTFDHVYFSYTPEQKLIQNFCFEAQPGQKIAIVGPTGCGKTTLVNLLMRFYDVTAGRILLDGQDTRYITRNSLRNMFGMVLQDTWLSTGTIKENIAYGKPDASMDEIIAAAKKARAHSFITRLENGYETIISDKDGSLSEGQRQLLSIARIMLENPPMLILDEATSNIDTRTEIYIQEAFDYMMQGRTSFIVAHRLSTIRSADTIIVMNKGNIVEQGNHEALLAQDGFYASLYKSQFAGNA